MYGINRARRVLSGTSLGTVVVGLETDRPRFFFVFCFFSVFFCSILGFQRLREVVWGKVISGIDRTRRVLSGTGLGTAITDCSANRTWKYSNRAQRYPTCPCE
jgi:hypothetical protein